MDIVVPVLQGAAAVIFGAAMIYAAISDLRTFEIPNWVSGVVVVTFLLAAVTGPPPWSAIMANVIASAAVLAVGFVLFALGYFGAGDVKLLTAIALWIGWPLLMSYLIMMVFAGGALTLVLILFRRFPLYRGFTGSRWIAQLYDRKRDVPYAVAISFTTLFFLPRMPMIADLLAR